LLLLLVSAVVLAWASYQPVRGAAYTMEGQPVMVPREGFHEVEQLPGWSGVYRWSTRRSTIRLPNPGGATVVRLVLGGGPNRTVDARLHAEHTAATFTVRPAPRTYALLLSPASGQRLHLVLTSPTIRHDERTLGVMVSDMRIAGGGAAPFQVILALLFATGGAYTLLWHVGTQSPASRLASPWLRVMVLIICQGTVLVWQAGGGWQYGLFFPAMLLIGGTSLAAVALSPLVKASAMSPATSPEPVSLSPQGVSLAHLRHPVLLLLLLVALGVRLPWLIAADPVGDLELAARRMWLLYTNGLSGAYMYDGDYMPLRLYLLFGLSHLVAWFGGTFHPPLSPITLVLIKLPGMLADLVTVGMLYAWSRRWLPVHRSVAIAALYTLSPPVWINVAWWGQVDALLMLPLLGMVVLMERADGRWSWLCWSVAFLIKPQAIVLAPLLYAATLRLHGSRGFLQGGLLASGLFALACLPLVLAHQGPGLLQAYAGSVGRFPKVTIGAYNLWHLLTLGGGGDDDRLLLNIVSYRAIGMVLIGMVALLVVVVLLRRAGPMVRAGGAAVLALAFFLLPTQIHERYLFLSLAFVALGIAGDRRMVVPYLLLVASATLNILGTLDGFVPLVQPWIESSPLPLVCAVVNLGVLVVLVRSLFMIE
jgi:hypothetical protein